MSSLTEQTHQFLIRGLTPNPYFPSDALLSVELDVTDLFTEAGPDYISWKQKLEDMLNEMDRKYAKSVNKLRGRKVSAAYKTIVLHEMTAGSKKPRAVKHRGRVLQIQPYPSRFSSVLGELRTEFYGDKSYKGLLRQHNAVPLSSVQHGKRRFITYFLHEQDAVELQKDVDKLNMQVDRLNNELTEFERSSDFGNIIQYLREKVTNGRWSRRPPIHSTIHKVSLNFTPLPLGREIIDNYTNESVKAQVRQSISDMVQRVAANFQAKLSDWLANLTELLTHEITVADVGQLEQQLAEIRSNSTRYQMEGIVGQHFTTCEAVIAALKSKDTPEGPAMLQDAATKVAASLHIQSGQDAASTLKEATMTMRKVDPETKALIEAML
jgi:hypothetical protein